eukprot:scaffold3622_cov91-Phaeocystis_antarctica.AAC.2
MVLVPVVPARMRPCQVKRRGQEPRVERSEAHPVRIRDGHLESARSGDGDDGEGAEVDRHVDRALPRRRHLVTDRGLLLGLGL